MGRFYHGAIEGKFWVGIQDSDDISNLVTIEPELSYMWKACLCCVEIDINIDNNEDKYCKDCYESKEEHEEAVIEEDGENEDNCLYIEEQLISYHLDKQTHYDELKENMEILKSKIDQKILDEFDKIEQNDKILSAFTGVFDNSVKKLNEIKKEKKDTYVNTNYNAFVARYTIGYQLEYCLRTTEDDCYVNCEC
tara:strand:+ start:1715 stop:2296 length:582 start_codon:yes stop_codon:yes gene_type:complete